MSNSEEELQIEDRPSSLNDAEFYRAQFWKKLQNGSGSYVPPHIMNILKFNCLDTPVSFVNIDEALLVELEKFAKDDMKDLIEETNPIMKNYYGYYQHKPENFKFVAGEKALIRNLVKYVKENPGIWSCSDPVEGKVKKQQRETTEKIDMKKAEKDLNTLVSKKVQVVLQNLKAEAADLLQKHIGVTVTHSETQYLAKITCPVCQAANLKQAIIKTSKSISAKVPWKVSNFARHLERHSTSGPKSKSQKMQKGTLVESTTTNTLDIANDTVPFIGSQKILQNQEDDVHGVTKHMVRANEENATTSSTNIQVQTPMDIEPETFLGKAITVLSTLQDLSEK